DAAIRLDAHKKPARRHLEQFNPGDFHFYLVGVAANARACPALNGTDDSVVRLWRQISSYKYVKCEDAGLTGQACLFI
ncbi:MAG: hypothetical protein ACOVN0_20970, partial [Niveispirillum sp.]|uniref:hypothetical protein n=1 Tax=Niveispirillum sp. TaxID=1917217 RepID=UPI003BA7AF6D